MVTTLYALYSAGIRSSNTGLRQEFNGRHFSMRGECDNGDYFAGHITAGNFKKYYWPERGRSLFERSKRRI